MNKQQLFNTVVAHLRQQNAKSLNQEGECVYRAPDGKKCAAGCLIPDDEYHPEMEGRNSHHNSSIARLLGQNYDALFLVRELQEVHDHHDVAEWEKQFARVALAYDLILAPKE